MGQLYRRGHDDVRPELWVYRGGRAYLEDLGSRLGFPDMFERTFVLHEYDAETPFRTAAGSRCCRCASRTTASRRTASA